MPSGYRRRPEPRRETVAFLPTEKEKPMPTSETLPIPGNHVYALSIYEKMVNPLDAIKELGRAMALSKFAGCESEAQGQMLAWECLATRTPPLSLIRENNIIMNRLSQKYDSMLAKFNEAGGKHRIIERTAERASVELTFEGQVIVETLTWEEAKAEPYVYEKDGKEFKKNWRTPRARRQTLWARVVSEGVRTLCPGVNYGTYTPEEIDGIDSANIPPVVSASQTAQTKDDPESSGEVVEAEFTVTPTTETETECTAEQRSEITKQLERLQLTDVVVSQLIQKHGGESLAQLRNMKHSQADALLAELKLIPSTMSASIWAPCSSDIVAEIKGIINDRQSIELKNIIKAHLTKHGKQTLAELSQRDAEILKTALEVGTLELFIQASLESPPKNS